MRAETLIRSTVADSPIVRAVPVGAWRSPVSALVWGTRGREFKSRRPDQKLPKNQSLITTPEKLYAQRAPKRHIRGIDRAGMEKPLQVRNRAACMGRNPETGEPIQTKASKKVAFRASKELKEAV